MLTTNKIALTVVVLNVLLIAIGYFGLLDPAGFNNNLMGPFMYVEGTSDEYWKKWLDSYYGISYITLFILSFFFIVFYRGKGEMVRNITGALKIQLVICLLVSVGIYTLSSTITENGLSEILNFNVYFLLIPITSAILINIKNLKNIKLIVVSALTCIAITLALCLQINLLIVAVTDQIKDSSLQFTKNGTPLYKSKVNLFNVEIMPDGVANIERVSKNYTDFLGLLYYPLINKTTNEEIFEMIDKFSKNYGIKDESYLKEKLGDGVNSTKLHAYNKFAKLRDEDVSLLNTYRTQGIDAAMKELGSSKTSLIGLFIEKKKTFDENELEDNKKM